MNTAFLEACLRKEPSHTPVWFMRQAGRYLPSYRRIKGNRPVTEIAKNADLASEVVVDAVRTLGVDAGILFADIMLPLEPMGVKFTIEENVGPVVSNPIRTLDEVDALMPLKPTTTLGYIQEGIELTIQKLNDSVPIIGFSGAPFTLAGYMIEGRPSRDLEKTKEMMYRNPECWKGLMSKLTEMIIDYLRFQIAHGVNAVQLFDSWVGCLSPHDYREYVSEYTAKILASLPTGTPKIHFCANSSSLIEEFHRTKPDVLSVDWRLDIEDVWKRCWDNVSVQGNLDPVLALSGGDPMVKNAEAILEKSAKHVGHIFSLGHGVLRETDPANLKALVNVVHSKTKGRA